MNRFKKFLLRARGKLPAWERTGDLVGYSPNFSVRCRMCRGGFFIRPKMLLRNSKLMIAKVERKEEVSKHHINRMNYKCPRCDWVTAFLIPDESKYILEIQEKRGGDTLYYPGIEEWARDKYAKAKLETLGYL